MQKKIFLFFLILVFIFSVSLYSQSITVISPNGGESWDIDSTKTIKWDSTGVSGNVIIKLLKGADMLGSIAWNISNTGSYNWTINNISGTLIQPGSDYKVLVRSFDDHSIEDQSNSNFSITSNIPGSITVKSPNGGESWNRGTTHNITWDSNGVSGNVIIKLKSGNVLLGSIAWNIPNTGSYSWRINDIAGNPIAPGNNYKVLIRSFNDRSIKDVSDGSFTIGADSQSSIEIKSPIGGERIGVPGDLNIKWDASSDIKNIRIIGLIGTEDKKVLESSYPAQSGKYTASMGEEAEDRKDYRIRIEDVSNPQIYDESGNFEIYHKGGPHLKIIKPSGGEKYVWGKNALIKWESTGFDKSVRVELWKNNEKLGDIQNETNNNKLNWQVPRLWFGTVAEGISINDIYGDNYSIKISAININNLKSSSNRFSILKKADLMVYSKEELLNKKSFSINETAYLNFIVKNLSNIPVKVKINIWSVMGKANSSTSNIKLYAMGKSHKSFTQNIKANGNLLIPRCPIKIKDKNPGDYTMFVKVEPDKGSGIVENQTENNMIYTHFKIIYNLKDKTLTTLSDKPNLKVENARLDEKKILVKVINLNHKIVKIKESFKINYYLNFKDMGGANREFIPLVEEFDDLKQKGISNMSHKVLFNDNEIKRLKEVKITLDCENKIDESNENDNTYIIKK